MKPGDRVAAYEIVSALGAGGMAEVFRARDTRLHRDVALKFIAQDLDSPRLRHRLLREARAASALNHPNICTIYEIGEHDGQPFIVMECLEGETLGDLLKRGPLEAERLVDFALQVADALGVAHGHGIIHRDLKPSNLFVTRRGDIKILDFGLAKLEDLTFEGADALTDLGMAIGTSNYMAPEQARGESTDARSDLFSFGLVLYQMATGRPAFGRLPMALVFDALLHRQPPPVTEVNPNAPVGLKPILDRLLEKDPQARFQGAAEVLDALRALRQPMPRIGSSAERRTGSSAERRIGSGPSPSLAVLPFANRSPDPENEYLSDGITEEIINTLGQLPQVRVAARTSSFAFKGRNPEVTEVGEKLKVSLVLSGSVQRAGARVRITAQLVSVADGFQLWSDRYDRQADDLFAIQDEIAASIAEKLKIELTAEAGARQGTTNLEAYQLYLKGRFNLHQRGAGIARAADFFERALAVDPAYAAAHAALGESRALLGFYGVVVPRDVMPIAKRDVERALELDPQLADAHATLGFIFYVYSWNAEAGTRELSRALELNPNHVVASTWRGVLTGCVDGRFDDAIAFCRRAYALDPMSPLAAAHLVNVRMMAGRYADAEETGRVAMAAYPQAWLVRYYLGAVLVRLRRATEAIALLESVLEPSHGYAWVPAVLIEALVAAGDRTRAAALYDGLTAAPRPLTLALGSAAAALGDLDAAFQWYERAFENRDAVVSLKHAAIPRVLREDPRFDALMTRVAAARLD